MPIQLSWYRENRVLLMVNEGNNTDQDMFDIDQPMINYLNQSDAPLVHLIFDVTKHPFVVSAKEITKLQFPKHPRLGWSILVGPLGTVQRFLLVVGATFFKSRYRLVNSLDEALDFLNEVDSTLPPLRDSKLDKAS